MSDDWAGDILGGDGDDDGGDGGSLFEDNFRRLVEDDSVDSLNPQTIEDKLATIQDKQLLADAIEQDERDDVVDLYRDRLGTLNSEDAESDGDDGGTAEPSDETATEADTDGTPDDDSTDAPDEAERVDDPDAGADDAQPDDGEGDSTVDDDDADDTATTGVADDTTEDDTDGAMDHGECPECGGALREDGSCSSCQRWPDDEDNEAQTPERTEESISEQADDSTTPPAADEATDDLPDVDVLGLAPDATAREAAAERDKKRTMLVWGKEGTGKSHTAHSAPEPIAYIDTEGKADELAEKFTGKRIHYWTPDDYQEAKDALDQALDLLAAYYEEGHRGTVVVDSMSVMWEWAQVHHMKKTRPDADSLDDVNFQSAFGQGGGDWQIIKGYHNTQFRDRILASPYHVVFTAGRKKNYDYDEDSEDFVSRWTAGGEKRNIYAVKDVVRLFTDGEGKTAANLRKAARTRYSFVGLQWPDWEKVYDAVDDLVDAETAPEPVDVTQWDYGVIDGQPVNDEEDDDDE